MGLFGPSAATLEARREADETAYAAFRERVDRQIVRAQGSVEPVKVYLRNMDGAPLDRALDHYASLGWSGHFGSDLGGGDYVLLTRR